MSAHHVSILGTGLVTAVGLSAPASCAAFRSKLTNPTETDFIDAAGDRIMAHQVELDAPWRGLPKLAKMAALAVDEALEGIPKPEWHRIPLLLCVAEEDRPGRAAGLDDALLARVQEELGADFAPASATVARGRVAVAVAVAQARALLASGQAQRVVIAAADSLLSWPALSHYEREDRLLTAGNSNGFMPGEAGGALLLGPAQWLAGELLCTGVGFGIEHARLGSGEPLRAEGLAGAIRACLDEAACRMHDMDFRITGVSGEQYYFKEAALALSRTLRQRKEEFDLWHPAECTGEVGAVSGICVIADAQAACAKGYARGPNILAHWSNDAGERAAMALQVREAAA